jgi:hypothetical protein
MGMAEDGLGTVGDEGAAGDGGGGAPEWLGRVGAWAPPWRRLCAAPGWASSQALEAACE